MDSYRIESRRSAIKTGLLFDLVGVMNLNDRYALRYSWIVIIWVEYCCSSGPFWTESDRLAGTVDNYIEGGDYEFIN